MPARKFLRDEGGATAIFAALVALVMVGFTALAVDTGYLFLQGRRLQGTADLAAIAAAQNPTRASSLAEQTITDNKWPGSNFTVTPGDYTADRALSPKDRFVAKKSGANAVQVDVDAPADLFFGKLLVPEGAFTLKRRATAAQTRWAAFQVGSRLASLNGGVANSVLSGLTGSKVSLSVADYQSLARADVDLLSYVDALRTRMNVEGASFDQTLSHNVDTSTALRAIGDVLRTNGGSGASSMDSLASSAGGRSIDLKNSIDLGPYRSSTELSTTSTTSFNVSALDLATGMLTIAGKDRQLKLDVGSSIPGIADVNVWLAVGEPPNKSPWISITNASEVIVRT
ncbi:MAG: pilus assembly protein TadG-related protein, partial [Caulobacterales bacterium]